VLQTPQAPQLTGNQDDPQAVNIHIEIEPLIQTLSFDFHLSPSDLLHVMMNDVKNMCSVSVAEVFAFSVCSCKKPSLCEAGGRLSPCRTL